MADHHLLTLADVAKRAAAGHSAFSPSSSKMWLTCSGSLIPNILADDSASKEAAEGTVAHSLAETWLTEGRRAAKRRVGDVETVDGWDIEITEEMFGFVSNYVDWVLETELEAVEFLTETRVDFSDLTPIPDQGGTADSIAIIPTALDFYEIVVTDLKYGKGIRVLAEGNTQGLLYAYGAWKLFKDEYEIATVTIRIAHPRLSEGFTSWTIPVKQLLEFAELVKRRAADAWHFDAPRTPSDDGCQWCKVKGNCAAAYAYYAEVTSGVFDDDDEEDEHPSFGREEQEEANARLEDELGDEPFKFVKPPALSTKALAKILRYQSAMEKFFNAVEAELLDRSISREEEIPGWKLVEGRANRKWPDDEVHVFKRLRRLGLHEDAIYDLSIITPAEAEKRLIAKTGLKKDQAAKIINTLAIKPPGKKSLVRASDNRKALPSDGNVFDDED